MRHRERSEVKRDDPEKIKQRIEGGFPGWLRRYAPRHDGTLEDFSITMPHRQTP